MYFNALEQLSDCKLPDPKLETFDRVLAGIASEGDHSFGATFLARRSECSIQDTIEFLVCAKSVGLVAVNNSATCDNCGASIEQSSSLEAITSWTPDDDLCPICSEELTTSRDSIWVDFKILSAPKKKPSHTMTI